MSNFPFPHLSVVIPAYNEAARLPRTLREVLLYLGARSYSSEVIVVDDGSTDGTEDAVRECTGGPVTVRMLRHPDGGNHGKGASVKLGMSSAGGDYRLFMDADNSTTIEQVEGFWPAIEEEADIVIGSRKIRGAQVVIHQPWYKELAGRSGNILIRMFAVPGISDTQAGFKLFTRRSAEELFPLLTINRWGYDFELLAIARQRRYRIREIPIRWINSPDSKVRPGAYLQVLCEVLQVHRNLRAGTYRREPQSTVTFPL